MITLDATNQSFGRLASKIAVLLRGKDKPTYKPNVLNTEKIEVLNASKLKFTGKKFTDKTYYRYSGYPGGIYARQLSDIFAKDPGEVLRKAVYNMLPENRSRQKLMKNLIIKK